MIRELFRFAFVFCSILSWSHDLVALEVDEKLTLRILKTSSSGKTILINRGKEDGLEKGEHAKFYLSAGVVARGVVIELSPTRSVWSLYRLVNADYVKANEVMRLKITEPVKITQDPTRKLLEEDAPVQVKVGDPRELGIELAPGAQDLEDENLGEISGALAQSYAAEENTDLSSKSFEAFGVFHYSSQSVNINSQGQQASSGTESEMSLDGGLEYFFKDRDKWYSKFGFLGLLTLSNRKMSSQGANSTSNELSYGAGANWYPWTLPHTPYRLIPFAQFSLRLGTLETSVDDGSGTQSSTGSLTQMSLGAGVKLYTHQGWGLGGKVEYLSRKESYSSDVSWTSSSAGPRISWMLFYRF